jgi:hypothetical protein
MFHKINLPAAWQVVTSLSLDTLKDIDEGEISDICKKKIAPGWSAERDTLSKILAALLVMEGMYPFYYCTVCTRVDLSLKTEFGEASRRGSAQLPVNFAACGFRQPQPQQLEVESAYVGKGV